MLKLAFAQNDGRHSFQLRRTSRRQQWSDRRWRRDPAMGRIRVAGPTTR